MKLTVALILTLSTVFSLAKDASHHHKHRLGHDHHNHEHRSLSNERSCGFVEPTPEQQQKIDNEIAEYKSKTSNLPKTEAISINVYWHVFYNSDGDGNLDDANIEKSMDVLNDAYAGVQSDYSECSGSGQSFNYGSAPDTQISFVLVNTTRTESNSYFDLDSDASLTQRKSMRVGACGDLNVFTGNTEYLGFATFPCDCPTDGSPDSPDSGDGVVVKYATAPEGEQDQYNQGDTLVHEVGHWLGLYHTFQGLGCLFNGDGVNDTPAERSAAYGCPVGRNTCLGGGEDPIHNFMDYSDDCCMYRFTDGQIVRMTDYIGAYRGLGSGTVDCDDVVKTSIFKTFLKKLH